MKEQAWIKWAGKFSGSHGHTLSEICEELDLDIEDLAQDPCVPLLHADTSTLTHAEKIQEVLYEAYANDALVEVYDISESGMYPLGMAKAKDVDIFQTSEGQGYIIEILTESGLQFRGKADNFQILLSGC